VNTHKASLRRNQAHLSTAEAAGELDLIALTEAVAEIPVILLKADVEECVDTH